MVFVNENPPLLARRVLYIGSSVPRETATGLDAVQQPLRDRYPVNDESNIEGIDSVLSVFEDSIQLKYVSDPDQIIHFPITSLTLCAAVRCITTVNGATGEKTAQFVSMTNPAAGGTNASRPSIFTAITRRTQGRRVLECHSFICASAKDAMDLVKGASLAGNRARGINGHQMADTQSQVPTETFERSDPTRVSSRTIMTNRPSIRLVPGEQVIQEVSAGPEFFEPVPSQGYFYSSDKTEVKKFNIEKLTTEEEVKPVSPRISASPRSAFDSPRGVHANGRVPTLERDHVVHVVEQPRMVQVEQPRYVEQPRMVQVEQPRYVERPRYLNDQPYVQPRIVRVDTSRLPPDRINHPQPPPPVGMVRTSVLQAQPQQADTQAPPQQPTVHPQSRPTPHPVYVRPPPQFMHPPPPPLVRPVYIPVPVASRPRFFSPPPSMMRRPYHPPPPMGPPMGPPIRPVFGPPVLIRRRRTDSRESNSSGSRSNSGSRSSGDKASSKSSRSRSPSPKNENTEPKIVNGDVDSQSESASRPKTPPRDYDRKRLSRRDEYERFQSQKHSPLRERNVRIPPPMQGQYPYDYVYWSGGPGYMPYPPFMMPPPPRGAQFRSRSVPPPMRGNMYRDYRKKKSKKGKKKKSKKFRDAPSEVSTDSYAAGYHSDMNFPNEGYQFYPPRDFRRRDKQFMNERSFSKSIAEQLRQTGDYKRQSAYELNEAINGQGPLEEFKLY